jgi:hypothetical protein
VLIDHQLETRLEEPGPVNTEAKESAVEKLGTLQQIRGCPLNILDCIEAACRTEMVADQRDEARSIGQVLDIGGGIGLAWRAGGDENRVPRLHASHKL